MKHVLLFLWAFQDLEETLNTLYRGEFPPVHALCLAAFIPQILDADDTTVFTSGSSHIGQPVANEPAISQGNSVCAVGSLHWLFAPYPSTQRLFRPLHCPILHLGAIHHPLQALG